MKARIAEVFDSIQGEGLYLGEKQVFVRFFGCNLTCKYCDTKLSDFKEYTLDNLLGRIGHHQKDCRTVSFTGGEPLLQKDFLKEILKLTKNLKLKNYLDTNGTLPEALNEIIDFVDTVAMDIKLASSTGLENFWQAHRDFLKIASEKEVFLKAVICSSTQEQDLREALSLIKELNDMATLILQPNSYEYDSSLREKIGHYRSICIGEDIATYIIPQLHKALGVK